MNKRALAISWVAVAPLAYAAAASADDLPARSEIDNVLIFPSGADVTRLGEISIPEGEHRVIVAGLPLYLNPDSLRAAFGSDAVIVGAVEAVDAFPEGGGPEEAQRLRDELQDLRDQMQAVDDRIATAQMQVEFLASQTRTSEAGSAEALDPDDWATALAAIENGGLAARRTILEARQERRDLERAAEEVQLQLDSWDDDLAMRTNVEIALTATQAVTTAFSLDYQVADAGWSALYEARLDSETATMALEKKIKVYQDTGEDWTDVRLSVSTAPPVAQLAAPTVYPPHLTLRPPAPPPPPAPAGLTEAAPAFERSARLRDEDVEDVVIVTGSRIAPVDRVDASFASTYAVGGRVDVASDAEPRTFTIGQEEVALDLVIRTAPRTSLEAFVTAKVTY
ncbi:MAG: mucoidy inhibitor MuiA family protein, partial [Maricaulaceae bacterium]